MMRVSNLNCICFFTIIIAAAKGQILRKSASLNPHLEPRFLFISNPFSSLTNDTCSTIFSGSQTGTCVPHFTCIFNGGKYLGKCSFGLKVCCSIPTTTPNITTPVVENFVSDPATATRANFIVNQISDMYCQLRVDFNTLDFPEDDVDQTGACANGQLTITGQANTDVPVLCGQNSGQHMYLEFADPTTPIDLDIVTSSTTSEWNIQTTQILCTDEENLAPTGCLQYFPESTGTVNSFNYRDIQNNTGEITYQQANLDYKVCIGSATSAFTSITWMRPDDSTDSYFTMDSDVYPVADLLGNPAFSTMDPNCITDYVEILGGVSDAGTSNNYCGLGFPETVTSTAGVPFMLRVVTDGAELTSGGDRGNVGFSLSYTLS